MGPEILFGNRAHTSVLGLWQSMISSQIPNADALYISLGKYSWRSVSRMLAPYSAGCTKYIELRTHGSLNDSTEYESQTANVVLCGVNTTKSGTDFQTNFADHFNSLLGISYLL